MECEEYLLPTTVLDALAALQSHNGDARVVAGGTDLVLELGREERQAACLVDISHIEDLRHIVADGDGFIYVGAAVTYNDILESHLITESAPLLAAAARECGSPEIRNIATIVGNVVSAQPAGDAALALAALSAEAEITDQNGARWVAIEALYEGVGRSKVDSASEIVTRVRFRRRGPGEGQAYERLSQRKALVLPMLNCAVTVRLRGGDCEACRIFVAPVAPVPFRSSEAEQALTGRPASLEAIEEAAEAAFAECAPRDSMLRGSSKYRRAMVRVLVRRALERAVAEASVA